MSPLVRGKLAALWSAGISSVDETSERSRERIVCTALRGLCCPARGGGQTGRGTMTRRWPRGRGAARRGASSATSAGPRTAGCWRRAGWCPRGGAARARAPTPATPATTARTARPGWTPSSAACRRRRRSTRPTSPPVSRPPQSRATAGSPSASVPSPTRPLGLPCSVRTSSSAYKQTTFNRDSKIMWTKQRDCFINVTLISVPNYTSKNLKFYWFNITITKQSDSQ